ncbi:putative sporulation protein YyaC [Natronobacillus azotifigens]|uniref:Spore protease YyaC n=1 Tax=Natronobacillus azotifigens TaxID=472978 RepID=A0A9J6RAE2_9BACI|nr:spore protease YyaC [Natronobacillus azotifigens]MCZ0702225.1 spore protease YyaC [Natronobacillus azotifigens]
MNLGNQNEPKQTEERWHYQTPLIYRSISDFVMQWLPDEDREIVIVCIGTDRSTGDALGPITGSLLSRWKQPHFSIYGTLKKPVHALNLADTLTAIRNNHKEPFIIAIDACLGRQSSIGSIKAGIGAVRPGLALKKDLPPVGDLHITGIVNASTPVDYLTLQNTRLHLVMELAELISKSLHHLHRNYAAEIERKLYKRLS